MRKLLSSILALVMLISVMSSGFVSYAEEVTEIKTVEIFNGLLRTGGRGILDDDIRRVSGSGISNNVEIDGRGHSLVGIDGRQSATIFQNENVISSFTNVCFSGCEKPDVGIWVGSGKMTLTSCSINGYKITTNRLSAIAAANGSALVLNDVSFSNNSEYDVQLLDSATLSINGSTSFKRMRASSAFSTLNIGENWSGSFDVRFDYPVPKVIGTVGKGADISKINVENGGYYLDNDGGKLVLKANEEAEIHFDMKQRETLYKGSTGFLYGEAEINVPSIDLLCGLKPDTMVQKAYAGKQHPTGDAIRTGSALLASGVKDMQIYLQDNYLEWPYDAPYKDGTIDLDAYQKTVEGILYDMICDKASEGDEKAFKGSDGNYYTLNETSGHYSYVLFNEPDQIWYGGNLEGLKKAWLRIYKAVHAIDPNARCAGPNYSGFNEEHYDSFLAFCKENNCLPELITWHELGDSSMTDFYKHYDAVKAMQKKYYTGEKQPELLVNEYARHYDIGSPGGLVKWLSMFENKDMSGCMAYWAMANTLNEMAADQNSPSSTWWVYHWYAQMTGEQCPIISPEFDKTHFYGLSSYDEEINTAYALFGGHDAVGGKETVYLDNIDSTKLLNNCNAVNAKIYAVSFSGQLGANYKPEKIFEGRLKAVENSLKISVGNTDEMQAYFAVLTKAEDEETAENNDIEYPVMCLEAEKAQLLGNATAYDKLGWTSFATSGRADVGAVNNSGDGVCFTVNIPEDGEYNVSLFYSLQAPFVNPKTLEPDSNGQNRGIGKMLPYKVTLDGKELQNIYLESTVTWAYKNHNDLRLHLTAGEHRISYTQIFDEGDKGNLQLVAALDKLDVSKAEENENDFEICLDEMKNFEENGTYRVTAVAPEQGYYTVSADGDFELKKQCVDYAADAKSFSKCSVYDVAAGKTLYLAKGANTLAVSAEASKLYFAFDEKKTESTSTVINSSDITLHGNNPILKESEYAESGYVISELGIGQSPKANEKAEMNYSCFSVEAPSEGMYNFAIRYANDEPAPIMLKADGSTYIHPYNIDLVERYAQITVNGGEPETVYFKNTLSWDTFRTLDVQLKLKKGSNTIKIYNDNSYQFSSLVNSTAPEIDTITVSKLSCEGEKVSFVKGAASARHNYSTAQAVTKATASKDGKIVITNTCVDCGYKTTSTTVIPKIASVSLSTTSYTYDGKAKKPAVTVKDSKGKTLAAGNYSVNYSSNTKVGTAKAVITFKGNYGGSTTKTFSIKPKGTSVSKLSSPKSKQIKVNWKKQATQTTGYEIQLATNSKFTQNKKSLVVSSAKTTSKTVSKLKGKKKYYVRIRTYKTVSGKKYYSSWSKVKTITTKK
ncbi:MAG: hypothetical protein IJ731_00565 [Eubacterium sp.]|nr:hypothetical protein [Eubacterium sp.]